MTRRRLASGEVLEADELEAPPVRPPPAMPKARPAAPSPKPRASVQVGHSPRTDLDLLTAIASKPDELDAFERTAFGKMLGLMQRCEIRALSYAQRAWAQQVASRVGFNVADPGDWQEVARAIRD